MVSRRPPSLKLWRDEEEIELKELFDSVLHKSMDGGVGS